MPIEIGGRIGESPIDLSTASSTRVLPNNFFLHAEVFWNCRETEGVSFFQQRSAEAAAKAIVIIYGLEPCVRVIVLLFNLTFPFRSVCTRCRKEDTFDNIFK